MLTQPSLAGVGAGAELGNSLIVLLMGLCIQNLRFSISRFLGIFFNVIQNSSEDTFGQNLFDHVVLVDIHIGLIFEGLFKYYISLN